MKKYIIFLILSGISIFATTSKVIYIPNTTYYGIGNLHLDVDNYFIQGKAGVTKSEFGLMMQLLPFKKLKLEASIDYKADQKAPLYLSGKLIIPSYSSFPNIAIGAFNLGLTSETLKPVYYLIISKYFGKAGKLIIGGYIGDKYQLRDNDNQADNKGLLAGYEVYLNPVSKNLYFGADYFMGENILSAVSLGIGWKFARNVIIKMAYHIKLKKNSNNLLGLQVNINTW